MLLRVQLLIFSYPSVLTAVFGAQKNCFIDISFEYPEHMFWMSNKYKKYIHTLLSGGLFDAYTNNDTYYINPFHSGYINTTFGKQ